VSVGRQILVLVIARPQRFAKQASLA